MSQHQLLEREVTTLITKAQAISAKAEGEGREFTDPERAEVKDLFDQAIAVKDRITKLTSDGDLMSKMNALGTEYGELTDNAVKAQAKAATKGTLGRKFTEADAFKNWFKDLAPTGEIPDGVRGLKSPPILFDGLKDILATGGGSTNAGMLVPTDERGLIEDGGILKRELSVRNLVTNGTTQSDTIHYVRVTGFTNNAAPVAEAQGAEPYVSGAGQVQGIKPQSTMVLDEDEVTVKTIAHWMPITKRALSDASQLRTLIDNFLNYGLEEELEDQMLTGSGTGQNFEGIFTVSGTQAQPFDTNLLRTTRKAKTKVRRIGRATPTAYLLNPSDNETFDLMTYNDGTLVFGPPTGNQTQTLWGLPRLESEAVPEGTAVVADWRQAVLYDREKAAIQVSDSHADFFIRNLVAILAELRAAFAILRPSAFCIIDLTA